MAAVQILPASRSELDRFLEGGTLSSKFHELFDIDVDETSASKKKNEKKKTKKKVKAKGKEKKQKRDKSPENTDNPVPNLDVSLNPSVFNVYSAVRQAVLERCMKEASQIYHHSVTAQSDSDSDDTGDEKGKEATIKIPKIVTLGLSGLFELVRETRCMYPELCVRALQALLNLLQGQQPESMKLETPEIVDGLFQLLMEVAMGTDMSLSSLACSSLISLTVAMGDTGKLLTAISSMLMSPACLAMEKVQVPGILTSLQKSVQAVLLGKTQLPDWFNQGVKSGGLIDTFTLDNVHKTDATAGLDCAVASDGRFLYILDNKSGIAKVGTGYGDTTKGHVYVRRDFTVSTSSVWLACAKDQLFCRSDENAQPCLCTINKEDLTVVNSYKLDGKGPGPSALFSDGENIGQIAAAKDQDSFVVRLYNPDVSPMTVAGELPLKLTRKCMDVFGTASYDQVVERHSINTAYDEDSVAITGAKEFVLIRTVSGKVLYSGKSQALGIKQGAPAQGKWAELPITKSPKIVQVATGHEGQHALMVSDDGSLFFVGTPRRGEDGDTSMSKGRRQPKAVKPKKLVRFESKTVIQAACNNGSSAFVTKEGEVFMFGKDSTYCDHASGHVTDLKDVVVTNVCLGKAHAIVLTNKGFIYSFGINNKGQCGRDFQPGGSKEASNNVTMTEEEEETEQEEAICGAGRHKWKTDHCMVCSVCGECTGYGIACVHSVQGGRAPGIACGCGSGDSGCSECGICKMCAAEQSMDEAQQLAHVLTKSKGLPPFEVLLEPRGSRNHGTPLEQFFKRLLEQPPRHGHRSGSKSGSKQKGKAQPEVGSDQETEYNKVVSLPPLEVTVGDGDVPVTQISCGQHHTVVLLQSGEVYAFGSNQYGQLGQGDLTVRGAPIKVHLPLTATQVATGAHHSVVLLSNGQVYTFGNFQKGALGRAGPDEAGAKTKKGVWYALPGPVPGIGARYGRRATWIHASGDQTYMRIDESLINAHILASSKVFANTSCIGLIPMGEENAGIMKCLMISKADGSCRSLGGTDQVDLSQDSVCLDPVYDVLWSYSPGKHEVTCYNVVASEARPLKSQVKMANIQDLFKPEISVPVRMGCETTRSHCALHLLGCLDTLTLAQISNLTVMEETKEKLTSSKVYSKEDFSVVNRFESHGGGWGYSGHSVEAVRFMVDTDIILGGYGLFGGRGEYYGRIKLFELGPEGGENESQDGELLAETEEMAFECGAREKFAMVFEEPVALQANSWYVAWARISGPSSDCGSTGQSVVTTDDQVVFKFRSSRKSNNGTDVNAGQIPQLLYRLPSRDSPGAVRKVDHTEPAHVLSQDFACSVSPENFEALLKLLQWSWNTFHSSLGEMDGLKGDNYMAALSDLRRVVYICKASLCLLRIYVTQIYPDGNKLQKGMPESTKLAHCVGDTQDLLRRILAEEVRPTKVHMYLSEPPGKVFEGMEEEILLECHRTFRACFHAFYPTGNLKWLCLCDLLNQLEPDMMNVNGYGRLLAAMMEAMCHPTIRLTNIMPINCEPQTEEILRRQSVIMDDNTNSMARMGEVHKFPILVSHMTYRIEMSGIGGSHVTFKEILDKLLMIVMLPVRQALSSDMSLYPSVLVGNTCSLLSTIVSELSATATGLEMDLGTTTRPLLVTPNRFTRTSQSAYWNTGNGSPDAISFSVDKPGIVIAGVCVYGGEGRYEYEMELLDDSDGPTETNHFQRWRSIEFVKGTYTPEDCVNDIAEIKFDRPVSIKEGVKYTIRLRNHGSRTLNGDNGIIKVKCPDGTTFNFVACSLSSNGTNHMRGQIPQILYYSAPQDGESYQQNSKSLVELQARKNAIDMVAAICRATTDILHRANSLPVEDSLSTLGNSHLFCSLLPLILAYIGPVASQDPRGAVQVLGMIQEILPALTSINSKVTQPQPSPDGNTETNGGTTSHHYAVVESDHPYKPATVANYKVTFPEPVKWMVLEFDPLCGTAQAEDTLQLLIPSTINSPGITSSVTKEIEELPNKPNYSPLRKKFSGGDNWPKNAIVLPGSEVLFSLETASDYIKDEKSCFYGFKCCIVGYEWNSKPLENLLQLEQELAYLGGMCAGSLIKKDIGLPPVTMEELDEDMDFIDESTQLVFTAHSSLLEKGFALSHPPTIMQALEGNLPFCWQSNERSFLKDFVSCSPGTSGGRLARWLQPDSYLDPSQCEIVYNKEELKCSWPAVITVLTKDQYSHLVNVPELKVEVKAVPIDMGALGEDEKRIRRLSRPDEGNMTFGGHPPPCLDTPYEPTVKDRKDVFHAICMMKAYENYSFEELRFAAPAVLRPSENMLVRANNDGTFSANWTPGSVGYYNIHVTIDGFEAGEVVKVEVKEAPQGLTPPTKNEKKPHQQTRMRRFVAKNSAGLRIRVNPSLQSELVGVIQPEGVISFVDEVHNDDGVWLRLSQESLNEWCISRHTEGWCLQYNQHLGKTLLVPLEEPKSLMDEIIKETILKKLPELVRAETNKPKRGPGIYQVLKCGSFGHNIRCRPSLKATPVGMLTLGDKITALEDVTNQDGLWVKIDPESAEQFCQQEGETWSLVAGKEGIVYLQHESDIPELPLNAEKDPFSFNTLNAAVAKGFDFGASPQASSQYSVFSTPGSVFGGSNASPANFARSASLPSSAFAFGSQNSVGSNGPSFGQSPAPAFGMSNGYHSEGGSSHAKELTRVHSLPSASFTKKRSSPVSFSPQTVSPGRLDSPSLAVITSNRSPAPGSPKSSRRDGSAVPPELQGVSVKELVKALGESRANGNGPTPVPSPPGTPKKCGSRSSSPHLAPDRSASPKTGSPIRSLSPRSTKVESKPSRGVSESSSQASLKDETFSTPPDSPSLVRRAQLKKEASFDRDSQSPPGSPAVRPKHQSSSSNSQKEAGVTGLPPPVPRKGSIGSPHTSPARSGRRGSGSPRLHSSPSRASPVNISPTPGSSSSDRLFNIGSASPKDESPRMSPKPSRKDRGRQLRSKRERASSPSSRDITPVGRARSSSASSILDKAKDPVKDALSPSVAECLRSVFAAFLWHEGIVHDAMACASFLKFHPDLQKEMSKYANRKKQEKMRVRHATDSSKDFNRRKENMNINEARVRFNLEPQLVRSDSDRSDRSDKSDKIELLEKTLEVKKGKDGVYRKSTGDRHKSETALNVAEEEDKSSSLPPTLHHLVYFWEELSSTVLRVITQELIYPSPAVMLRNKKSEKKDKEKNKKSKKKKENKVPWRENAVGDAMAGVFAGGGPDKGETSCELCGSMFSHPVTFHMRQTHPGCGRHAGGKGYNSSGNYCGGWAGNCGEGGYGGSSWYLICERCREKYLKEKRQQQKDKEKVKKMKKKNNQSRQSVLTTQEPHTVLKNNAMFLMDLASASGITIPIQTHKKYQGSNRSDPFLPSVYEEYGSELNPFPPVPFQYLISQSAQNSDSAFAEDFFIDMDERVFVRSGSLSINQKQSFLRPRLPTEPRHSPLARSGSLGQDFRPPLSQITSPSSPKDSSLNASSDSDKPVPKSAGTSPDSELEQTHKKTAFQRSISEIVSDSDEGFAGNDRNRQYAGRRRNNSGGVGDGGMSLIKHPSAAMSKLMTSVEKSNSSRIDGDRTLQRPVMAFIVQRHDLDGLQLAMKQALRKATCRVFAMQAMNWLMRTVSRTVCIHDLLWYLVTSLTPPVGEEEEDEEEEDKDKDKEKEKDKKPPKKEPPNKKDAEEAPLCEHPLADIRIAGSAVDPLPEVFHTLLQTIADVMMHLPWGSSVQLMAVRCFCLKFQQADHQFLHECHVFSNISRILSKSDEEKEESDVGEPPIVKEVVKRTASHQIWQLKDVTANADIQASSRQAMIASLTDNSTETFWESGDEDRNKIKTITVNCHQRSLPKVVYVHIDNTRDLGSKVNYLAISAGATTEEMKKLQQFDIEARQSGWISCHIPETQCRSIQLELKGPDHSLRVRQIKVLGDLEGENSSIPAKKSAQDLQQDSCEAETLKVFRLLTSQVFGKLVNDKFVAEKVDHGLISGDSLDGDHNLKEHMVGILFSRSGKLSHLQKQVCSHIVQGIRKETSRVKEEWEVSLNNNQQVQETSDQDAYCFELLSMVLALSGSGVGRAYLAQQYPLLQDLFSLLHTGSPRVQRQVIAVLRRVLPDVKPQTLASILSVTSLPPAEYSIVNLASRDEGDSSFHPEKPNILDVLLSCISKALTVQTKVKISGPQKGVNILSLSECLVDKSSKRASGPRWWMRGKMSAVLANNIISLIHDMGKGQLSETWATVTKAAIAEAILNLTKLDETHRAPETCIKTPTLWLALASLCVLDQDHVERLTSGQWVSSPNGQHGQPRPTCDNHDDGETQAIILCNECGNLCAECDRFLHLPRKKRTHQRQVFKEEEEAIKVDLHEGCGRTKLFWVMSLADSKTLKAMVEFREGRTSSGGAGPGTCRFCGTSNNTGLLAIGNVCADAECQEHAQNACTKVLPCGHACGGIKNEDPCLPCLHRCRTENQESLKQDADDMCMICFTEALAAAPAIKLKCNHLFHLHCTKNILEKRWVGPRITFGFSLCPICKATIEQPVLRDLLKPIRDLYSDVKRKAMMRLEYEGLHKAEAITTPGARFYQDPAGFAMERYAYYVCYKCKKAYYGGEARCDEQAGGAEDYDPQELVCGGCSDVSRAQMCPKHGTDFLEYKCRYCCSVAVFFCFGTTHFCNICHDDFQRVTNLPKTELPHCPAGPRGKQLEGDECPLHVQHPATGEEFALGCGVCRNAHTF
ncbi:LOW QUALITY PROTEIN: E3 ubiquitin-protein ligase MYCBP2-like [Argopecten irradians]|uniref:LOW QUALITY PROTEIN: E3 ubiquitin-protein ligase MYCBP2-like n=1 Tax=Argopecten irradians TaxID=31199 RepID=UPI00371D55B3